MILIRIFKHECSFYFVVGRTGSGKSSLALRYVFNHVLLPSGAHACFSLLRLIPTDGEVYFDGVPSSSLNLESLRGAITIIPQQPELMVCGKMRSTNLCRAPILIYLASLARFEKTLTRLLNTMMAFLMMVCVLRVSSAFKRIWTRKNVSL